MTNHVSRKKIALQGDWELQKSPVAHQSPLKPTAMVSHCHYAHDKTVNSLKKKTNQYTHQSPDTHRSIHAFSHPDTHYLRLCKPSTHWSIHLPSPSPTLQMLVLIQSPQDWLTSHGGNPGLTETLSSKTEAWEDRSKRKESHINDRLNSISWDIPGEVGGEGGKMED